MSAFFKYLERLQRLDVTIYSALSVAAPLVIYFIALAIVSPSEQQALVKLIWDPLAGGSTLLVYMLAVVGGNLAARRALRAHRREVEALKFCERQITAHRGGIELSHLENAFVRPGSACDTSVEQMVKRLWESARLLRYEPSNAVLSTYVPAIAAGSRRIKSWQTLGIRFGILGTFIGLILALVPVAQLFATGAQSIKPDAAVSIVGSILQSLSIAFGTSISGLLAAVLLQLQAGAIRDREDRLLFDMEGMVGKLQTVFVSAVNNTTIGLTMSNLQRQLLEHRDTLSRAESGILAAKDGLERTINEQASALQIERANVEQLATDQARQIERLGATYQAVATQEQRVLELSKLQADLIEALRAEVHSLSQSTIRSIHEGFGGQYRDALDPKVQGTLDQLIQSLKDSSLQHALVLDKRMQEYLGRAQGGSPELAHTLAGLQRTLGKSERRNWLWFISTALMAILVLMVLAVAAGFVLLISHPDLRARAIEFMQRI